MAFSNIVSVDWLAEQLSNHASGQEKNNYPALVILDATMKKMPNGDAIPEPEYFIPGARVFNFDTEICDLQSDLPHMLPSAVEFERAVQNLGINSDSLIICYDAMGVFSSPRAWWMFKVMGHSNVKVLDGGLPAWRAAGCTTHNTPENNCDKGNFVADFNSDGVVSAAELLDLLEQEGYCVIDARSRGRFDGTEAEPRAGLDSGHIPGSLCLPFTDSLDNGAFKARPELLALFKKTLAAKIHRQSKEQTQQMIFTCGSGVTASVLALIADECGYHNYRVYDGSWSEWGQPGRFPVSRNP